MAELAPTPGITEALRGTFSEPITTIDSTGNSVTQRFRLQGSGQWHIPHVGELKKAAGIMHHSLLTDRYGFTFANGLLVAHQRGLITISERNLPNPQAIRDADIVYHAGRIAGEEARDNPEIVDRLLGAEEGARRRGISYEALSLEFIEGKVPPDPFAIASAKGRSPDVDPDMYESYSYLLSNYADHTTTNRRRRLAPRMATFLQGNYFDKTQVTDELKEALLVRVTDIVNRQRNHGLYGTPPVSFAEAEDALMDLGAKETPDRGGEREYIVEYLLRDPLTEATLIKAEIKPNKKISIPLWERQLRREYVASATNEFVPMIGGSIQAENDTNFPTDTWWGQIAREIYNAHPERRTPQIQVYPGPASR